MCVTSWYPEFSGSHSQATQFYPQIDWLDGNIVSAMTYTQHNLVKIAYSLVNSIVFVKRC